MIDWLTFSIDGSLLPEEARAKLRNRGDRVQKISAEDGTVHWDVASWESLTSDMNGLAFQCSGDFRMAGSPARITQSNNVFGSDDIVECFTAMRAFACKHLQIVLPAALNIWKCSRIDVTQNYCLGGPIAVKQALSYLRHAETRGNNVCVEGDTVYWNKRSSLRCGKAYHKGPQALKQQQSNKSLFTDEELDLTQSLLRLELKLGRHFLQRHYQNIWWDISASELNAQHERFFRDCIGDEMKVNSFDDIRERFIKAALELEFSEGVGESALRTHRLIQTDGIENVKRAMGKSAFYNHRKVMLAAGLSKADLAAGRVLEFRRAVVKLGAPVTSWEQLRGVA